MTQITTTLNQLKAKDPYKTGWHKIKQTHGGDGADMDQEFPVSSILDRNGFENALWALRCLPEYDNLWRKYAVWCSRQVEHLMTDKRSKDALEVAWRHSEGMASEDELKIARCDAYEAYKLAIDARACEKYAAQSAWNTALGKELEAAMSAQFACTLISLHPYTLISDKLREILDAGEWVE